MTKPRKLTEDEILQIEEANYWAQRAEEEADFFAQVAMVQELPE